MKCSQFNIARYLLSTPATISGPNKLKSFIYLEDNVVL